MAELKYLFSQGKIGRMTLRNKIAMSPMVDNFGTPQGYVTKKQIEYYKARSKGGVGLVIVGASAIDFPRGKGLMRNLSVDHDKYLPGLSELAEAIKAHGARAAIQIHHAGREARREITRIQPIAPSAVVVPPTFWGPPFERDIPRELTTSEIQDLVLQFAEAVLRCKKAGFDGVELHADSGYLINQFLSAASNKRKDQYGGSIENRARFLVDIIKASKENAGGEFPIWCRLTVREYGIEGGARPKEAQEYARMAENAGADAINTSVFVYGQRTDILPPTAEPPGNLLRFAQTIKEAVKLPVVAASSIAPELGEEILKTRKADIIGIGRGLIADPELPNKALEGRITDIVPCIRCMVCLDRVTYKGLPLACSVNATVGRELECKIKEAKRRRAVAVLGGGPAGLEAARVAAIRGHKVKLFEKSHSLGGQLLLAAIPPHKPHLPELTNYLVEQIKKQGVEVRFNTEINGEDINKGETDAIIVATGSKPSIPQMEGVEKNKVFLVSEVLAGDTETGDNVCVVGGGLVGCEVAELLVDEGKHVTIVEMLPEIGLEMPFVLGPLMRGRLKMKGVIVITGNECNEITSKGIIAKSQEGVYKRIRADTVVFATGAEPNDEIVEILRRSFTIVHVVGDCQEPGTIHDAISSGFSAGINI